MHLRKAPWTAVAAATAFPPLPIAPLPYDPKAEGGSCCYRNPRRASPAIRITIPWPRLSELLRKVTPHPAAHGRHPLPCGEGWIRTFSLLSQSIDRGSRANIRAISQIADAIFQDLEDRAAAGDRAAAESLRMRAEAWSRAAHLATNPDRSQRRKAQMNTDAIIHNRDS